MVALGERGSCFGMLLAPVAWWVPERERNRSGAGDDDETHQRPIRWLEVA